MQLYPLLPGESIEFRATRVHHEDGRPDRLQSFWTNWDDLYEEAQKWDEDFNCYFGVAPRVPDEAGHLGGGTKNVPRCPVVWLDLDCKEGFTREDRLRQLEKYPPTFLTDSGYGYHCFYVLDRDMEPKAAQQLMGEMAAFFRCDNVGDPPHILRIPNTRNYKDPENPKYVTLLWANPEDRWNPEALPKATVPLAQSNGSGSIHAKRVALIENHGVPQGGQTLEDEWFEGRNKAMFDVAVHYFHQHWERGDVLDHLEVVNKLNTPPLEEKVLADMVNRVFTYEAPPVITAVEEAPLPTSPIVVSRGSFEMISIHDLPEPTKPKYLWKPYFLLNRLVLLDGEEGIGKGLFLCYLASKFSEDHPFAWFTAEDDPVDDVNPRVRAAQQFYGTAGKSSINIHFNKVDPRFNASNEAMFDMLEQTIETYNTKVLVFDPGRSFIGPSEGQRDFSYNNEADIRPTMQRLIRLSREREVSIIFVHHFNKNSTAPLRYRTTGTGAWRQTVRQQVTMLWDYLVEDGVFGVQKSNIGPTGATRSYTKKVVDDWAVFVPSETLDPISDLEAWAKERAKTSTASITVVDPEAIYEQVREWAFEVLAAGDNFPARSALAKNAGISQEDAKLALKYFREQGWISRPKGRQGGGYIWTPAWTAENPPNPS